YMRMPSPRHPPSCFSIIRPPPTPTLFPYTTLFRSHSLGNQKHSALYNYHRTIYYNPKIDSTKAHQVCPYVKSIHQNESKEQGQWNSRGYNYTATPVTQKEYQHKNYNQRTFHQVVGYRRGGFLYQGTSIQKRNNANTFRHRFFNLCKTCFYLFNHVIG